MREQIQVVRQLSQDERAEVNALIRRATAADGVSPVGEHKYLKLHTGSRLSRALLMYDGDRLVGYAQLLLGEKEASAELVIDPDQRGRGLGRELVAHAGALAAAEGASQLHLWAYGGLTVPAAIAARRGLSPSRTLLQLQLPLADRPPDPSLGKYSVRAFDPARDRDEWLRLHNEVFADHPENGKWSPSDLESRLEQPWFDARDFLIAESDGRMVGFNWLKRITASGEGEIYIIGVAGAERRHGLGRALALRGLHHLRERGMRGCTLFVEGDNEPGLRLYRSLGFTVRHTHRCYVLPLTVDAAAENTAPTANGQQSELTPRRVTPALS